VFCWAWRLIYKDKYRQRQRRKVFMLYKLKNNVDFAEIGGRLHPKGLIFKKY
jgi:hypothetical protein